MTPKHGEVWHSRAALDSLAVQVLKLDLRCDSHGEGILRPRHVRQIQVLGALQHNLTTTTSTDSSTLR